MSALKKYTLSFTRNHNVPLRLRKKLGKITSILPHDFTCSLFGQQFSGNTGIHMDHKIYMYGCHESSTVRLLRHLLEQKKSATYMDIGTNSGMHILATATVFDKAYGFEPNPSVHQKALNNMDANGLDERVTVFNVGLSDQNADLSFAFPEGNNLGVGQFVEQDTGEVLSVRVGDELCAEHNIQPDVIKIDVEGHEKRALLGLKSTLKSARPAVVFEYAEDSRDDMAPLENRQALFGGDYQYFGILRSREYPKLRPFDPARKYENVLAIPGEDVSLIQKFL